MPAVVYGTTAAERAEADGHHRRAEGAAEDPALRVGREHADLAEACRRGRHARAGEGVSARSRSRTRSCTPTSTASRWTRCCAITVPITVKGEAPGVKQQGGILEYVHRQVEVECLPGDIPEHIEINIGELMLHQGVRVRDVAVEPEGEAVTDADTMLVHVIMPKAEEVATPAARRVRRRRRRRRRPNPKSSRRARRKRRREEEGRWSCSLKLIVGLGNPGDEVLRDAAQRRLPVHRRAGATRRSREFEPAPADALIARVRRLARPAARPSR